MAQHMDALAEGNRVRFARAELKRRVFDGEVTVAEVLDEQPFEARTMTISALLGAQMRWSAARARRFLEPLRISEVRTVEQLTARQRDLLAGLL
jgi:hypothetical protein